VEFRGFRRTEPRVLHAQVAQRVDLTGTGIGMGNQLSAPGWSRMGGVIRKGEVISGIRHALAASVAIRAINPRPTDGQAFVWPASTDGRRWDLPDGEASNLSIGTLLAIPPNVDIRKLGLGESGPVYEIARALQDYGAYIVAAGRDADFSLFVWEAELPAPEVLDELLSKVIPHLRVVINNSPETPAGGGVRRRPPAPPISLRPF
jgi:hypothetical protein